MRNSSLICKGPQIELRKWDKIQGQQQAKANAVVASITPSSETVALQVELAAMKVALEEAPNALHFWTLSLYRYVVGLRMLVA